MKDNIEHMKKVDRYFVQMNKNQGVIYLEMKFPRAWVIPSAVAERFGIKSVPGENGDGCVFFFASEDKGYSDIFEAVEFTIEFNEILQAKYALLSKKINELKDIFAEEDDMKVLEGLTFKYRKKKEKPVGKKAADAVEAPKQDDTANKSDKPEEPIVSEENTLLKPVKEESDMTCAKGPAKYEMILTAGAHEEGIG